MVDGIRTPLWPHQRAAIDHAVARSGSGIAVRMGGGKTLTTIALAHQLDASRVLVACPLSVVSTWPREIARHSSDLWEVCALDRGSVAAKAAQARLALDTACARGARCLVVVNHESLWRQPFADLALAEPWSLIVYDEVHRMKAPGGKLSKFAAAMRKAHVLARRVGLTGTPMPHGPLDLYAQARALDTSVFGTSYQRFVLRYAIRGGFEGREVVGFQREDELMRKFHALFYDALDVDLDLPGEVDVEIPVRLEASAMALYRKLEREFWIEVGEGTVTASNALVKLLRLQQISGGRLPLDDGAVSEVSEAKAVALADLLADLPAQQPVVVFGRFTADLESARLAADSLGRTYGEVSGRRKDLEAGRIPPGVQVLGVNIQAGGVGIDLSRACVGVFVSTGFNLGDYLQARARLHRPGQTQRVTFLHLLANETIDWVVYKALAKRQQVIESLLAESRRAA